MKQEKKIMTLRSLLRAFKKHKSLRVLMIVKVNEQSMKIMKYKITQWTKLTNILVVLVDYKLPC